MDGPRWTEEVDDLVDAGNVDGAIALLESVVSNLSTSAAAPSAADLRLATALGDLAGLHASRGNTLRADDLRARAIVLRSRAAAPGALGFVPLLVLVAFNTTRKESTRLLSQFLVGRFASANLFNNLFLCSVTIRVRFIGLGFIHWILMRNVMM